MLMEARLARIECLWGNLSQGLDARVESVPAALALLWLLPTVFGLASVPITQLWVYARDEFQHSTGPGYFSSP